MSFIFGLFGVDSVHKDVSGRHDEIGLNIGRWQLVRIANSMLRQQLRKAFSNVRRDFWERASVWRWDGGATLRRRPRLEARPQIH
jgi:hypothetical protein